MGTKTITIFAKQRKLVSFDRATEIACNLHDNVEFKNKVNKTHILYGFAHMFFEPVYVTDGELREIADKYGSLGTVYCLHR